MRERARNGEGKREGDCKRKGERERGRKRGEYMETEREGERAKESMSPQYVCSVWVIHSQHVCAVHE